jgi:hypothetical protein
MTVPLNSCAVHGEFFFPFIYKVVASYYFYLPVSSRLRRVHQGTKWNRQVSTPASWVVPRSTRQMYIRSRINEVLSRVWSINIQDGLAHCKRKVDEVDLIGSEYRR